MTHQLVTKLRNLAVSAEGSLAAAANALAPKLHEAADGLETKLESWTSAVDVWVETDFAPEAAVARHEAGAAYRDAVKDAHTLVDEAKTHL